MNMHATMPMVPLGEVAKIDREGISPDSIVAGTKYLGLEHIEAGGRILDVPTVANGELASTKFAFGPHHLLYGKLRPYLAKIALPDFEGVCSTDIVPVCPGDRLDRRYLAYFLRQPSMVEFATSRSTGANLPRLSPKALAEFAIPLPPLEEQKRIAAILDQADALRRLRRRALDRLNALGQAIFHEMFGDPVTNPMGWPKIPVGRLCSRVTVGIVVRPASYYREEGVAAVRGTNIKDRGIDLSDLVYFSNEDNDTKLKKTRIWADDLVIVRSGRPGLAAVVPKQLNGANAIDVLIATPNVSKVSPYFLRDFLNSAGGKRIVLSETRGQVQQHFNVKSLSEAQAIVPPISQQSAYEERLSTLAAIETTMNVAVERADAYFAVLQHQAFAGKL